MYSTGQWYIKLAKSVSIFAEEKHVQIKSAMGVKIKMLVVLLVVGLGLMLFDTFTDVRMVKRGVLPKMEKPRRKRKM